MARDTGPQCKQCRREGQKLFLKGERCLTEKCGVERRSYPPGEHGRGRMRQSEYRQQLREKQKARRYYQVLEKQFRSYYDKASRQDGVTGENLLRLLERRFDNVLVRLGFAASRRQARQLIGHGHWLRQRAPGRHPLLPGAPRRRDLDQAQLQRRRRRPLGDGAHGGGAAVAAGGPRLTDREGTSPARPQRDHHAGLRAADRRALLEVVGLATQKATTKEAMTTLPEFQIPKISSEKVDDNRGTFTIEPLDKGFGYTFGNSLRRVLLSSLGGAAIKSVRIEGVAHEFSTVPGVKEDVTDIVLNLKDIVVRMHTDADEVEAPLVATGPGEVKAKDIDLPGGRRDPQPGRADRDAREADQARDVPDDRPRPRLLAGRGEQVRGPADRRDPDRLDLLADPARRPTRSTPRASVSGPTSTSSSLEIETDGSIEPATALREAAEILIKSLAIFTDADRVEELTSRDGDGAAEAAPSRRSAAAEGDDRLIEELEIGVRAYNCLKRAGIQTVGDLVQRSESELNAIPNFGKRSTDEVKDVAGPRSGCSLRPEYDVQRSPMRHGKQRTQAQP